MVEDVAEVVVLVVEEGLSPTMVVRYKKEAVVHILEGGIIMQKEDTIEEEGE